MNERIKTNPKVCNGNPCISGTRITILDLVTACDEMGTEETIKRWPDLAVEDIHAAIEYCKSRRCDEDGEHCGGCSLRPEQDEIKTKEEFVNRFQKVCFVDSPVELKGTGKEGIIIMPGTSDNLEINWRGINGWEVAGKLSGDEV